MQKKKLFVVLLILIASVLIAGFVIPKETHPPSDTRIVLEHNQSTYIAPTCFEEADPSNFLEENTLEHAEEINYEPHDTCTVETLQSEEDRLLISVLKDIGLLDTKWDD
ncbi:hypothetical protein J2Z83_000356 [Virgibacillus natechei]|uniref:Secreted protein n=1 Tax=Virgibacillus natechei TaxID=1216297 RepID=A0ABS4IBF2_9BACI|nr:hypothetical protein [Virgibacillus natechei]MBP1968264.1 hypothetical protein [Virgibacillus natechei]UZD14469.1 hypothetical protein OLD84_08230 [Virgibacillus natechei]